MGKLGSFYRTLATNVYVQFFGSLASILGFFWIIYDRFSPSHHDILELIISLIAGFIFFGINIYSVRVRQENDALKRAAFTVHNINHHYRDTLCQMFGGKQPINDPKVLITQEQQTLELVCAHIARIYNSLIHADCMVTVKVIYRDDAGKLYCGTHARSEARSDRDRPPSFYKINEGLNTAFDQALLYTAGGFSHYYSADLLEEFKENRYRNQRDNWSHFYKSAIVVPIRYLNPERIGMSDASDDI